MVAEARNKTLYIFVEVAFVFRWHLAIILHQRPGGRLPTCSGFRPPPPYLPPPHALHHFTALEARQEAHRGWLSDNKYLAIVWNPTLYDDLQQDVMGANVDDILSGTEECLFLCHRSLADDFAYVVRDETELVGAKNRQEMVLTRAYTGRFERREYILRAYSEWKLVHYGREDDDGRKDKVAAVLQATELEGKITDYATSSRGKKKAIIRRIRRRGGGNGSGGGGDGDSEEDSD